MRLRQRQQPRQPLRSSLPSQALPQGFKGHTLGQRKQWACGLVARQSNANIRNACMNICHTACTQLSAMGRRRAALKSQVSWYQSVSAHPGTGPTNPGRHTRRAWRGSGRCSTAMPSTASDSGSQARSTARSAVRGSGCASALSGT